MANKSTTFRGLLMNFIFCGEQIKRIKYSKRIKVLVEIFMPQGVIISNKLSDASCSYQYLVVNTLKQQSSNGKYYYSRLHTSFELAIIKLTECKKDHCQVIQYF